MLLRLLPIISVGYHFLNLFQTKYHSNRWSNRRQNFTRNTYVDSEDLFKKIIGQQSVNHCANRQKYKCLWADKNRNHVLCFWVTCRSKRSSRQIANLFTHFPKCLLRFLFSQHLIPSFHIVEDEIVGLCPMHTYRLAVGSWRYRQLPTENRRSSVGVYQTPTRSSALIGAIPPIQNLNRH